jgi:hypothetical protein
MSKKRRAKRLGQEDYPCSESRAKISKDIEGLATCFLTPIDTRIKRLKIIEEDTKEYIRILKNQKKAGVSRPIE